MSKSHGSLHSACIALLMLSNIGCQSMSPYGYGGYPGGYNGQMYAQPGYYGTPGMAPGTQVVPPGGMQAAPPFNPVTPAPITPATPMPNVPSGAVPNGSLPRGADITTEPFGEPEAFPGSSTTRPAAPDAKLVPNYPDPDTPMKSGRNPVATPDIDDPANFKAPLNGAEKATQRLKQKEGGPSRPLGMTLNDSEADSIQFMPSQGNQAGSLTSSDGIQTVQHTELAGGRELSPYGRAANGQDWFRGLVDYDDQEKTWYLIYNPEPGADDPHGGTITLIDHPNLKLVQGDDVILVEGNFDPSHVDRNGHAKYRIEVVRRLVP